MSTGLELIPLALAAAGAAGLIGAKAHRAERRGALGSATAVASFATRWRDEQLLVAGLSRLGAGPEQRQGAWAGSIGGLGVAFTRRADGVYDAHFDARTPATQARAVLDTIDRAYCVELQTQLRRQVLSEAPRHNMTLVDEYEDADGTVVLTLELGAWS
jgi:hypothetical protein